MSKIVTLQGRTMFDVAPEIIKLTKQGYKMVQYSCTLSAITMSFELDKTAFKC